MDLGVQLFGVLAAAKMPAREVLPKLRELGYTHVEPCLAPEPIGTLENVIWPLQDFDGYMEILAGLEGLICQVHVKDGENGSMSLTPLGEGNGRFRECAEILLQSGYSGWIILENEFKAWGRDNDRLLTEDIRTMKQAFENR